MRGAIFLPLPAHFRPVINSSDNGSSWRTKTLPQAFQLEWRTPIRLHLHLLRRPPPPLHIFSHRHPWVFLFFWSLLSVSCLRPFIHVSALGFCLCDQRSGGWFWLFDVLFGFSARRSRTICNQWQQKLRWDEIYDLSRITGFSLLIDFVWSSHRLRILSGTEWIAVGVVSKTSRFEAGGSAPPFSLLNLMWVVEDWEIGGIREWYIRVLTGFAKLEK